MDVAESSEASWTSYGFERGPNGPRFDYLHDWIEQHRNNEFEVTMVDFKWKDGNSQEWFMADDRAIGRGGIQELDAALKKPIPKDVPLRVFTSENISPEALQMIGHRYEINAWSFNDLFMEIGNHREGSYYSKFTGDTRPYVRIQLPSWWQVLDDDLVDANYTDGTQKTRKPHRYPTSAGSKRRASVIQREFAVIASQYEHCWICIFLVENIDWLGRPVRRTLVRTPTTHTVETDVLQFGYEKDTQTYRSLRTWLLEYIERDQMLAMTYMLRYMANSWREIIAGWSSHLEIVTQQSFSEPNLRLSRELHDMTNTFLQYIRGLHGTIEVLKSITGDEYLRNGSPPMISNDNGIHFQRVVTLSEEQIRDLQDLRERSANLIGMIFNTISIQEANHAIIQGQSLKYISILATIFVPISLFSSLFGMNIKELGVEQGPPAHSFIAVTIPSTLFVFFVAWVLRPIFAQLELRRKRLATGLGDVLGRDERNLMNEIKNKTRSKAHAMWKAFILGFTGLKSLVRTEKSVVACESV